VDIADILVIMVNWNKVPINTDEAPYVMHEECNIQEDDLSRYYGKFSQIYYSLGSDSKAEIQMRNRLEDIFGVLLLNQTQVVFEISGLGLSEVGPCDLACWL
jgi:hypothetical protein